MMSSSYWNETSSSSCGTQQPPEVLQGQPQHYHCYHQSSQVQQPPEKNVVYERVRTYSGPMNKVVQALDPISSREVLSPLKTSSSYQNLVWSDHSQELHSPTVKVTTYPQTTIRRYIVQNPEQVSSVTRTLVPTCSCLETDRLNKKDDSVIIQDDGPEKLDPKYFGELLADLSRKNTDLYHCLLEHLQRIGGSKQDFESTDESEDIESLIPKGLSEFTKQQIRYILQMRGMSDKSLRLVLSTFSNIREELGHLQNDLTSLENDKIKLEKDLAFKETQIKEYEELLASVRTNNRQQQQGLQDSTSKCQALEESNLSLRHTLSDMEYRLKELEYCKRNLEQENKNLRTQVSETCTGPMLQVKMDEIGNHYMEMVKNLRTEKDREISKLRTQLNQYQKDVSRREGSFSDFQFKLHELTSLLEEKDALIKRQSEVRKEGVGVERNNTTQYRTQYPILGLLYDDYEYIPPGSDTQTIVIEKTEDKWTRVSSLVHF
uniref:POF1B actin binding protein n=1 Tax=Equus asinus TaxID=9793 RepID=A0A9L0IH02_EQUAS